MRYVTAGDGAYGSHYLHKLVEARASGFDLTTTAPEHVAPGGSAVNISRP